MQAKHWARDQLVWPAVVSVVITFFAAWYLNKKIDWELFRTGLLFYIFVFLGYLLFQFIRAGWRMHQEQDKAVAEKDADIQKLGEVMGRRAEESAATVNQYANKIWRLSNVQKELDVARVALINAKNDIERLTWPEDRPQISFVSWGQMRPQFMTPGNEDSALLAQHGFYLHNDGGAALEITVEIFDIAHNLTAVGSTITRIKGKDTGFVPIWIKEEMPLRRWALDDALEKAWGDKAQPGDLFDGKPLEIPVSVVYRDYNQLWYRSRAKLSFYFEAYQKHRIEFSAVEQDKLGIMRPVLRTEFYV